TRVGAVSFFLGLLLRDKGRPVGPARAVGDSLGPMIVPQRLQGVLAQRAKDGRDIGYGGLSLFIGPDLNCLGPLLGAFGLTFHVGVSCWELRERRPAPPLVGLPATGIRVDGSSLGPFPLLVRMPPKAAAKEIGLLRAKGHPSLESWGPRKFGF